MKVQADRRYRIKKFTPCNSNIGDSEFHLDCFNMSEVTEESKKMLRTVQRKYELYKRYKRSGITKHISEE